MLYDFQCAQCERVFEEVRSVDERDRAAECDCGGVAERIFTFTRNLSFGTFQDGYYHAFGKHFTQKHQLNDELLRYKDCTGSELIEVGNEKSKPKPVRSEVDWDGFGRELKSKWRN